MELQPARLRQEDNINYRILYVFLLFYKFVKSAKKGYIPNADAIGNERWTNGHHAQKATYYKASEVHEDADAARELIKLKRKEYNQASKKRKEKREKPSLFVSS